MAVPPLGAQAVISAVLKTFAGIPYESVESKITNGEANAQEIASLFDKLDIETTIAL